MYFSSSLLSSEFITTSRYKYKFDKDVCGVIPMHVGEVWVTNGTRSTVIKTLKDIKQLHVLNEHLSLRVKTQCIYIHVVFFFFFFFLLLLFNVVVPSEDNIQLPIYHGYMFQQMMMDKVEKMEPSAEEMEKEEEEKEEIEDEGGDDVSGNEEKNGDDEEQEVRDAPEKAEEVPAPQPANKIGRKIPPFAKPKEKRPDDCLNLNNEVVRMRKEVKRVRALIIRKLTRQMGALKKKKGKDTEIERNQRRAARLLEEIHAIKALSPDLVSCLIKSVYSSFLDYYSVIYFSANFQI